MGASPILIKGGSTVGKLRVILCAAMVIAVTAGCGNGGDSGSGGSGGSGDEVVLGVVAPQTGFAANYGPEVKEGIDLALAENKTDVKIKTVTIDEDVLDASKTLQRVQKMVDTDGAQVVIGPVFGSNQQAVAPYLSGRGVPWFSILGASEELATQGAAFIWPGADGLTAGPLGTYAAKELGYKKIATLAPDYSYGRNVIDGAVAQFKDNGGTVVQQQWVPLGTTDMLQYATSLDKSADALLMWLVPNDAAAFVREYRNLGIKTPLLMFQGIFDPTFQEVGSQLIGEIGLNEYNPNLDNAMNKEFIKAYEAKYKGIPNQTTAFAYTVTKAIIAGLDKSGGDTSVKALRKALDGLEMDTIIGPARYNADGIASSNRFVVKAEKASDGRFIWTPIKTYEDVGAPK